MGNQVRFLAGAFNLPGRFDENRFFWKIKEDLGDVFVQEFVIGLGLLSGMGVDPDGMILQTLSQLIPNPSFGLKALIFLLPWLITIVSIFGAFIMGGWIGIIAVGLAFFGGIFINSQFGAWLLVFGILIGLISPKLKRNN